MRQWRRPMVASEKLSGLRSTLATKPVSITDQRPLHLRAPLNTDKIMVNDVNEVIAGVECIGMPVTLVETRSC